MEEEQILLKKIEEEEENSNHIGNEIQVSKEYIIIISYYIVLLSLDNA